MTDYVRVYDPKGLMFEIAHERASQLVLNHGWSKHPVAAPAPAPAPVVAPAPVAEAPVMQHTLALDAAPDFAPKAEVYLPQPHGDVRHN